MDNNQCKGKNISDKIRELNNNTERIIYLDKSPWYYINKRYITNDEFSEALDVYTNNQQYYYKKKMIDEIRGLEHWFLHVIEPPPNFKYKKEQEIAIKYWLDREFQKKLGRSYYRDRNISYIIVTEKDKYTRAIHELKMTRIAYKTK